MNRDRVNTWGLVTALWLLVAPNASAQIAESLNYQGYLTDAAGAPLDSATNVTFSIYAVQNGGSPLWSDTQVTTPEQGLFNAQLGASGNPFPAGLFDTPLWLGITVGADAEMTPRREFAATPYSHRARDADTIGGINPSALDQSADVATLESGLTLAQSNISVLQTNTATQAADIAQLDTDLSSTGADLTVVENTLPTLQPLVSQFCSAGSSIRAISGSGTVTCEIDDFGPWLTNSISAPYVTGTTRIGIGTSAPAAALQIDAPLDTDPFRARVQSSTKLRVHTNGSVSVGTSSAGPENGLYVLGNVGFGTTTPGARASVADPNWQMSLDNTDVGGSEWFVGSSANAWQSGGGKLIFAPTNSSSNAAMTIDGAKNIGIGTFNPATRLHVAGGSDVTSAGGGFLLIGNTTSTHIAMDNNEIMGRNNGVAAQLALNAEGGLVTINSGGNVNDDAMDITGSLRIDSGENSGVIIGRTTSTPTNSVIQPTSFEVGLVGFSGAPFWRMYSREFYARTAIDYRTYSDRSLKRNIQPIGNALETVQRLEGVSYELLDHPFDTNPRKLSDEEEYDRKHQLGFIAQDVEEILPQLVKEDEDSGLKTVGYMGVIPILVEAIKTQQQQIDAQATELAQMKNELAELKRALR